MTPEQQLIEKYKQILSKGEYPRVYYSNREAWVNENLTKIKELEAIITKKIQSLQNQL